MEQPTAGGKASVGQSRSRLDYTAPVALDDVETTEELRFPTGMHELDRVLGGGAVRARWC